MIITGAANGGLFDPEGPGYEEELRRLGIPYAAYTQALGSSNSERAMCPEGAAKTAPGFYAFNGAVAGFTSGLRPPDWKRIDLAGTLPMWVHADLKIKFAITSGSALTGIILPGYQPRTRYAKGELIRQMVHRNAEKDAPALFDLCLETESHEELSDYDLWLLLMYFDKARSEIRSEFSHPVYVNAKGLVTSFTRRIIPPPYMAQDLGGDDPNEGFGGIDFPVTRR